MKEYKILIVDDYPEHIMVITEILLKDSFNYQILAAPNGKVALEIAKKENSAPDNYGLGYAHDEWC
jgi:CheY-like chemotaxis protein